MRTIDLATLDAAERRRLTRRSPVSDPGVREQARSIVEGIRDGGDSALAAAGREYGGGPPAEENTLATAAMAGAVGRIEPALLSALEEAAAAITSVHRAQIPTAQSVSPIAGVEVERRWAPLRCRAS